MKRTDLLCATGIIVLVLFAALLFFRKPGPSFKPGVAAPGGEQPVSLSRADANGVAWTLDQAGGGPILSTEPNGPKAGPPIFVKADVQRVGSGEMSIGLVLEGQAGEQYRPAVKKNGSPLSAPTLRIINEAGQVIAQDSFQYG